MHKIFNWVRNSGTVRRVRHSLDDANEDNDFGSSNFDSFFDDRFAASSNPAICDNDGARNARHHRAKTVRGKSPEKRTASAVSKRATMGAGIKPGKYRSHRIDPPNPFSEQSGNDAEPGISNTEAHSEAPMQKSQLKVHNKSISRGNSFKNSFKGLKRRLTPRRKHGAVDIPATGFNPDMENQLNVPVETTNFSSESAGASSPRRSPLPTVSIFVNEEVAPPQFKTPLSVSPSNSSNSSKNAKQNTQQFKLGSSNERKKFIEKNAITAENVVDDDELSELSHLGASYLDTRKSSGENSTLRGSSSTLNNEEGSFSNINNEKHNNINKINNKKYNNGPSSPPPTFSKFADERFQSELLGRRQTVTGPPDHHPHQQQHRASTSIVNKGAKFSSSDALLQNSAIEKLNLSNSSIEKQQIATKHSTSHASSPITKASCEIFAQDHNNISESLSNSKPNLNSITDTTPQTRKMSSERLPMDAARSALMTVTATAIPSMSAAADEIAAVDKERIPPQSELAERRRLRFLVPQISVSSVDSVPRAIAKSKTESAHVPRIMTQSASAATSPRGENPFADENADENFDFYGSTDSAAVTPSTSTGNMALATSSMPPSPQPSPAAQRRSTEMLRRRASLAARRQSNVQMVQKAVGRRASTTLIPLTPAQIHLVRALWRQVFLTKGPTVVGQTMMHRLFFKCPKLKELFRRCPVPPEFGNHDYFAKHHCKAVGDVIDQIVENLDDLQCIELDLEAIGRSHARLMEGQLSSKVWNSVAETFIDCTLEWGDRRSRSETVRKAWALIVAFTIEKIKHGHLDERKHMMALRSTISSLENVVLSPTKSPGTQPTYS